MKKITNKILIVTLVVFLLFNIIFVLVFIRKYNNHTIETWFDPILKEEYKFNPSVHDRKLEEQFYEFSEGDTLAGEPLPEDAR